MIKYAKNTMYQSIISSKYNRMNRLRNTMFDKFDRFDRSDRRVNDAD